MPNTSRPVSVCVSKWISPIGPRRAATADAHGSVIEWSPPSVTGMTPASTTSPIELRDRRVRVRRVGGQHGRVAVVDDAELGERVDTRLEMRAGRARRGADRARREPRARAVRDEVVHRRPDDRDVDSVEVRRLLRDRRPAEGEEAGVVGLVRQRPPAGERVDRHARNPPTIVAVTSRSAALIAAASSGSWPSTQPVRTSSSAP